MNCTEFDQHWRRRLDVGAGIDPAPLRTHLAECPRCQAWQRAWETLERAIDQSSAVLPANDAARPHRTLADRVVAELQVGGPSQAIPRGLRVNSSTPFQETGEVSLRGPQPRGPVQRTQLVSVCLAVACLVSGSVWFRRPSSTEPPQVATTESVEAAPLAAAGDLTNPMPLANQPSGQGTAADGDSTRNVASGSGAATVEGGESEQPSPQPRIVKPLVGMVHNLTSLVLPGWPSVFNDSVGIPHYLDGETSPPATRATSARSLPDPLVLVPPSDVPWPEPVEELLAVASESVQTMWDLANQW